MAPCTNLCTSILTVIFIWISSHGVEAAIYDLYNTKISTSDLRWTIEPRDSWEELSVFDRDNNKIIRAYQVCRVEEADNNNWLRSPFISTRGASRVKIDIEFSITKCEWSEVNMDYCRQTFNLFYYWSERDVASSTFPPWQERSYFKIDTVAANGNGNVDKKTFTIEGLKKTGGIYIAAQDQGACMSLVSLRVYYNYCKETIHSLAKFEETMTGKKAASLVNVPGTCIENAEMNTDKVPTYYCGSSGEWQIITGSCKCKAGFFPNTGSTACIPCPVGYYKSDSSNGKCTACPANSGPLPENASTSAVSTSLINVPSGGLSSCPCHPGYARASHESASKPCTRIPSAPIPRLTRVNATSVYIAWDRPLDLGNRDDLYYRFSCEYCDVDKRNCRQCPERVSYSSSAEFYPPSAVSLQSITKYHNEEIEIENLEPYTRYIFKVFARNGVSDSFEERSNFLKVEVITNESVPSAVTNIYVKNTSPTSVAINWQSPAHPRGKILGYDVEVATIRSTFNYRKKELKGDSQDTAIVKTFKTSCSLEDLQPDTEYTVRIRAKTSAGEGEYSANAAFKTPKGVKEPGELSSGDSTGVLVATVVAVLAFAVVCGLLALYYRRRKSRSKAQKAVNAQTYNQTLIDHTKPAVVLRHNQNHQSAERDSNRTTYVDYPDPRRAVLNMNKEVSPFNLKLHNSIGEGEFAVVYRATMMDGNESKTVAAKQLKDSAGVKDQSNFLREACTMAQFDHPNILQLKGVVIKHKPEMIISEFMENGSLHQFIKNNQGKLSIHEMVRMLHGIANGMKYLCDMQFVHRDLAARNILVDSNYVCKVADFGLSRTLENDPHATYTTQGGKIALRWTAPECIRFREFTSASDVWSFGILMWEVMSYGEKPYWHLTNNEVMQSIANGMRLPAPTGCPKALHELMLECWYLDPIRRPSFHKIVSDLNRFLRHSSLLQIRQEDEMEQEVCCSPIDGNDVFVDQVGQTFLEQSRPLQQQNGGVDYPGSESSSISQNDTCSSVIISDERCLNV